MNVERYTLKSNCSTDAEKEQVVTYIKRNESLAFEMNEVNKERDNM